MKFIAKNPEPPAFQAWKEQEAQTLEKLYLRADNRQITPDKIWNYLPSNEPNSKEEGVAYFSKKELAHALLTEQGYICAYCMRRIEMDQLTADETIQMKLIRAKMKAEIRLNQEETLLKNNLEQKIDSTSLRLDHVEPKSKNPRLLTFKYENLLASCNGGQKIPPPRNTYCDCSKEDNPIGISPLQPDCETVFYFTLNGEIKPTNQDDHAATDTIEILGLSWFNDIRKETILGFYFEDLDNNIVISQADATLLVDRLSNTVDGKFEPYCLAVINVLKREILAI